jgi:hypothetical protein
MSGTLARGLTAPLFALALAGCVTLRTPARQAAERAESDWRVTRTTIAADVAAGRYAEVDRMLVDFQRNHPGAAQQFDAAWYRAFYRLDPSNPAASTAEARTMLEELASATPDTARRSDVQLLHRVVVSLEARPAVVRVPAAAASGQASGAAQPAAKSDDAKAKDDEIARLRDELAKANAELERVRRRIATPKP